MTTGNFSVLMVCTANQCRSPMAEFLLHAAVRERGLNWQVSSAGTHAVPGLDMHPFVRKLLTRRGIEVGEWCSTPIDECGLDAADLVLTASREQRSLLARVFPEQRTKIIPLLGLARLTANGGLLQLGATSCNPSQGARHAHTASRSYGVDSPVSADPPTHTAHAESIRVNPLSTQGLAGAIAGLAETPMTPVDDLDDPIGLPYRHFKSCAATLDRAIGLILAM